MKKIMLFCSQGMSTSMLVNAMKEAAEKKIMSVIFQLILNMM